MFYESNEPYSRVAQDGVVGGMLAGAAVSAAGVGVAHGAMGNLSMRRKARDYDILHNGGSVNRKGMSSGLYKMGGTAQRNQAKFFGSGWRGAATYGSAAALGGLLGGAVNTLTND